MKTLFLSVGIASLMLLTSCFQQPPAGPAAAPAAAPAANDVGRWQIVTAGEGGQGTILLLLDSKEGNTWVFRPPQGPAINGWWSDIPRITYPPQAWDQAFRQLMQGPATATNPPPAGTSE